MLDLYPPVDVFLYYKWEVLVI